MASVHEPQRVTESLCRIRLLGGLSAIWDGGEVSRFETAKTGLLLAYLAYPPVRPHTRESLTTLLWPDAPPALGRNRLSQALSWLRQQFRAGVSEAEDSGFLDTDRYQVCLNEALIQSDVAVFLSALNDADTAQNAEEKARALTRALAAYSGPLLPDHYDDWTLKERERLAERHLQALVARAEVEEQRGFWGEAAEWARRALEIDPLDESSSRTLMRALARGNQTSAALRHFRELEVLFQEHWGEPPPGSLVRLAEEIRHGESASSFEKRTSPGELRLPSLPLPLARLYGRETEMQRLRELLIPTEEGMPSSRLVTLLGSGGSGKTRLAQEVLKGLLPLFGGAVCFVALTAVESARGLAPAILTALGETDFRLLDAGDSGATAIAAVLQRYPVRNWLFILDNFEQLAEDETAVGLVRDLLERLPGLSLLVTSRRRLDIEGEQTVLVPPLPVPTLPGSVGAVLPERTSPAVLAASLSDVASVQLFLDRVRAVRPTFALSEENASTVAELCARLEGIPLAIVLCAPWAATLTPFQMLERLQNRFDLLVSRRRDIPERHRTLRATVEYSYQQLSPDQQRLFVALSVFRGGWTLESAGVVCPQVKPREADIAGELALLEERSLILAEEDPASVGGMRYRMLETLREFAELQATDVHQRQDSRHHADYFLALAEQAADRLRGPEQAAWYRRLEREYDNLRAALAFLAGRGGDVHGALRLAAALGRFWTTRGYLAEGKHWLVLLLSRTEAAGEMNAEKAPLYIRASDALGYLTATHGDYPTALEAYQKALALARREELHQETSSILLQMGNVAFRQGQYKEARARIEESLALSREQSDASVAPLIIGNAVFNLGNVALAEKDWPRAAACFQESLATYRRLGNQHNAAAACNNLGLVALLQGNYALAQASCEESLVLQREIGDTRGMAAALRNLGAVAGREGKAEKATDLLSQSLRLCIERGDREYSADVLLEFAYLAVTAGRLAEATGLFGAVDGLRRAIASPLHPFQTDAYQASLYACRSGLSPDEFDLAWMRGQAMTMAEIAQLASSE